jgi:hypothetical protein
MVLRQLRLATMSQIRPVGETPLSSVLTCEPVLGTGAQGQQSAVDH